jgi:acetyltransferase-like isoleucine patch superfamily enzyme
MIKESIFMFVNVVNGFLLKIRYVLKNNIIIDFFRLPLNSKIDISKNCHVNIKKINVYPNVNIRVRNNATLKIGRDTFFNNGCIVTARNKIEIGDNVLFGPNAMIFDHNHNYKSQNMSNEFINGEIKIGNNTWIGANVVILKDSFIGDNCVIAAGVTVSGINIPDNSIYFGNGIIKKIKK